MSDRYTNRTPSVRLAAVAKLRTIGGVYDHIADFVERDVVAPSKDSGSSWSRGTR
jgi:hypothetical protein